mgnify:CR=1 FL=1
MTLARDVESIHNDVMNYVRQYKDPSRFGFYRIAADQAEKLLDVMKELLKDPLANAELLAPHKVDTSAYEKAATEEQKNENQQATQTENKTEKQNNANEKDKGKAAGK